jgi:hypothetical protein
MAAFTPEEFTRLRIDCWALVYGGVVTVEETNRDACIGWLQRHGYRMETMDLGVGFDAVAAEVGRRFDWVGNFGYAYEEGRRGLDALSDGFHFDVPDEGGVVLELLRPEDLFRDQPKWLLGLLGVASRHSAYHMAHGRRFFALLVLPDLPCGEAERSPLLGQVLARQEVGFPQRRAWPD